MVPVQSSESCSPGVFANSHLYTVMMSQMFKLLSTALGKFYQYKTSMVKKKSHSERVISDVGGDSFTGAYFIMAMG